MTVEAEHKPVYTRLPILQIFFFLLFAVALIGSLTWGLSFLLKSSFDKNQEEMKISNSRTAETKLEGFSTIKFHETGGAGISPSDLDLYLETSNLEFFSKLIPGTPLEDELLVNLVSSEDSLLFELYPQYSLLQKGENFGLVFKILNRDKVTPILEELELKEPWRQFLIGDYLVFSNSEDFLTEIENAFKKRNLPLSIDSTFQESVVNLPKEGLLFMYLPNREKNPSPVTLESDKLKLIPSDLLEKAFVIQSANEGKMLIQGLEL